VTVLIRSQWLAAKPPLDLAEKCEPVLGRAAPPLEIGEDTLMNLGARRASRGLLKKPS